MNFVLTCTTTLYYFNVQQHRMMSAHGDFISTFTQYGDSNNKYPSEKRILSGENHNEVMKLNGQLNRIQNVRFISILSNLYAEQRTSQ